MLIFLLATLWLNAPTASAESAAFFGDSHYQTGAYGFFPTQTFRTDLAVAPRVHFAHFEPACQDGRSWFLEAHAVKLPYSSIFILAADGSFIWSKTVMKNETAGFRQPTLSNIRPFTINGTEYLSYWIGTQNGAFGIGEYHLLDNQYNVQHVISGKNGLAADPHELSITPEGTAIYSSYYEKKADLTKFGHENGTLWDSAFQEVDIATGELLFDWRASDHFSLDDMVVNSFSRGDYDLSGGLDWFHINSIDKDKNGDYLVSSRYASALIQVDGKTGKVKWVLGGHLNDFKDLSGGHATNFFCQHMARWTKDGTEISLFDNGAYWGEKRRKATGVKLALDIDKKTIISKEVVAYPGGVWSESQGSMQVLDDGGSVLGYGYAPRITQFDQKGKVMCDMEIAPSSALVTDHATGFAINEWAQSYRSTKHVWHGKPADPPSAMLWEGKVYVSWLGDTETATWVLSGVESDEGWSRREKRVQLGRARKTNFETKITLSSGAYMSFMELEAFDKNSNLLGHWRLSGIDGTVSTVEP